MKVVNVIYNHVEWSQRTIESINNIEATLSYTSLIIRLAPKVPDYTCPDIDFIVDKVENHSGFTKFRKKLLVRKLERLRIQNEALRDSGEYWYKKFKNYLIDCLD